MMDTVWKPVRTVAQEGFAVAPACIGFGCASLGSRVSAAAGLRALAAAHERGVNWFDVAPAYGAGEAETILAEFLRGRRGKAIVTTKVGMAPPARIGAIRAVYALGRPVIGALSGLRAAFRKVSATRNVHMPLSADLVAHSIAASLRRLRTDHVDVFALHDPDPQDIAREDVRRALEDVVSRGQARRIAIAGKAEACRAARKIGAPYSVLQMSVADFVDGVGVNADQRLVLHSVFGVGGARRRLERALAADADRMRPLLAAGYDPRPARAAADLLIDSAFAYNPDGVVLASMFDSRNLAANLARAALPVSPHAPALLRAALSGA